MWPFADVVYILCFLTSLACMVLLFRGYRRSGAPLLLWSAWCFVFLALNNMLLYVDLVILPDIDLRPLRVATALAAVLILLFGFIWNAE